MKHYRKSFTMLALFLLLSLAFTGLASADVLHGKGWLRAKGSGVATLHMTGHVEINGHGVGVVYIHGAEKIVASGHGKRLDYGRTTVFHGYQGTINVTGERMVVKMVGGKIDFFARGKGTAILRGRGMYETGGGSGDWTPDGLTLEVVED